MEPRPSGSLPRRVPRAPEPASTAPAGFTGRDLSDTEPSENWIPLARWCRQNDLGFNIGLHSTQISECKISSALGSLCLQPGSAVARWEGINVYLGFPPAVINDEPCIRSLEIRKTLVPLLSAAARNNARKSRVVAIDPGHGGHDSGTRSVLNGDHEKDFTLDWALRLKAILLRDGYEPVLTRVADVDMPISNRVAATEGCDAAIFVSLHFNASGNGGEQAGVETYCLTPVGIPSSINRGYDEDPAMVFPNNSFDAENLRLGCSIHRSLLRVTGNRDRGVRRARFLSVLRGQRRPAVLVEGGYLSNAAEARLIGTSQYRQELAMALATALEQFLESPEQQSSSLP